MPQAFRDRHELVSMSNDFAIIVIKLGVSMSMMLLLCVLIYLFRFQVFSLVQVGISLPDSDISREVTVWQAISEL